MCGIAGYFGQGNLNILKSMTGQLRHRGPDDEGFYFDDQAGLGHSRLSIIDLSASGRQPMSNEKRTVWLIFNGEIYNFQELKAELKQQHQFKSNTDTEVIIHLYEEIGQAVFTRLNGMFAIALYDSQRNKLILARDRLGKKPLYWGIFSGTLLFASEIKALFKHPLFSQELDLSSLNKYLLYDYVPTPNSIFRGLNKLEAGQYLIYNGQEATRNKFWEINFTDQRRPKPEFQMAGVLAELDDKLNSAVKARLLSDVPLGIFLSGGIDSSAVAYYAQKNSPAKIKTFSIGFSESSFDESSYARQVADYLGTDHYEQVLSARACYELIPKISQIIDEPLADASILPTYLLSKFTREKVTVALGGDGGDELFCGYDTFRAHQLAKLYERLPGPLRRQIIERVLNRLPVSFKNFSLDFKIKKFLSGFAGDKKYRHQHWLGSFGRAERSRLLIPEIWRELERENEYSEIDNYLAGMDNDHELDRLIHLYLRLYLMDQVLVKVDRASMAHSLEVRAPLLDYRLVDYVNSLPPDLKLRGLKTKYILKKLMADKLPAAIVNRPKKGFGVPLADWLAGELKPLVLELLSEARIKKQGLFQYHYIKQILDQHFNRRADHRKLIWTLLVFQLWAERYLK